MFERFRKMVAAIDGQVAATTAKERAMDGEKLTAAEQSAEKQRKADLSLQIERMDDTELGLFAKHVGVDPEKMSRQDLVAAVELKAEADAAAGRQAIRDMEKEQGEAVANEDVNRPAASRIIRALNVEFCRDIPQEARAGGFEPEDDHDRFGAGASYDVPNGKYRVAGSEWMFTIHKKRLMSAERATEQNKWGGKHVIPIE